MSGPRLAQLNVTAFGGSDEADLVETLRGDGHSLLSLVAEFEGGIVGHIMFSRMWINTSTRFLSAAALAPVSVLPEHQGKGIGTLLIQHGLKQLPGRDEMIVMVVGHPDYYPRFGISTARAKSLEHPFPVEAFMVMELRQGALDGIESSVVLSASVRSFRRGCAIAARPNDCVMRCHLGPGSTCERLLAPDSRRTLRFR
jgi:putative acetyltransferase